jgi:tetratricopeptide (TPR) repeat protein
MKFIRYILERCFILYILIAVLCYLTIDHRLVVIRTVNYWQPVPSDLFRFAQGKSDRDVSLLVRATRYYRSIVKILPSGPAYGALGFCYYHLGDESKAILYYKKAVETDQTFFGLYHNLGALYYKAGDFHQAIDMLQGALKAPPQYTLAYRGIVNPYEPVKDNRSPEDVKAGLEKAYAESLKLLVASYRALKDDKTALSYAINGLRVASPGDDYFYREAGIASFQLGQYENATGLLTQALSINGEDAQAVEYLVRSLKEMHKEALSKEVLSLAPQKLQAPSVLFPSSRQPLFYYLPHFNMIVNGQTVDLI